MPSADITMISFRIERVKVFFLTVFLRTHWITTPFAERRNGGMNEGRFYAEHKKVATSDMKPF